MTPKALLSALRHLQSRLDEQQQGLERGEAEALHELRISLRRLRSLIKPIADQKPLRTLDASSRALAQLSNPVRELEVLLADLEARQSPAALPRRQHLTQAYASLCQCAELSDFQVDLFEFLAITRTRALPERRTFKRRVERMLQQWQDEILTALPETGQTTVADENRHALRIAIKRLRYSLDTFAKATPRPLQAALKTAQDALGDWHDRWNWLHAAALESDLQALVPAWQDELEAFAQASDTALRDLAEPLRGWQATQPPKRNEEEKPKKKAS